MPCLTLHTTQSQISHSPSIVIIPIIIITTPSDPRRSSSFRYQSVLDFISALVIHHSFDPYFPGLSNYPWHSRPFSCLSLPSCPYVITPSLASFSFPLSKTSVCILFHAHSTYLPPLLPPHPKTPFPTSLQSNLASANSLHSLFLFPLAILLDSLQQFT